MRTHDVKDIFDLFLKSSFALHEAVFKGFAKTSLDFTADYRF